MKFFDGNISHVEREYLRHMGMWAFNYALRHSEDEKIDAYKVIQYYQEAKGIFELLEGLYPNGWVMTFKYIGMCNESIADLSKHV